MHFERNVLARVNPRNREIRRRTRVVGSFPDGRSALMLVRTRALYHVERVVDAPLPRPQRKLSQGITAGAVK